MPSHDKKVPLSHGAKVGLLLPYVMEFNLISDPGKFAEVARLMGENTCGLSTMDAALKSVASVRRLLTDLGVPQRLSDVGITEADIPNLVEEFMTFQFASADFMNPREVGPEEAAEILEGRSSGIQVVAAVWRWRWCLTLVGARHHHAGLGATAQEGG